MPFPVGIQLFESIHSPWTMQLIPPNIFEWLASVEIEQKWLALAVVAGLVANNRFIAPECVANFELAFPTHKYLPSYFCLRFDKTWHCIGSRNSTGNRSWYCNNDRRALS